MPELPPLVWRKWARALSFVALAGGIGWLASCHGAPALTDQESAGKHLYLVHCAHCHEDNDLALKKVPPNLHDVFAHATLPSGAPGLPAHGPALKVTFARHSHENLKWQ